MPEKQDSKQNQGDGISTAVGLTATAVCAMSGFFWVMTTDKKDSLPLQGTYNVLLGLIMMGASPVVGFVAAGVSELSLFAHKKIFEKNNEDEPLAKLKTP
jgi:hypothetical protein